MTKTLTRGMWTLMAAVALVGAGPSAARAEEGIVANVPFDFIAGDVQLPAGDYLITAPANTSGVIAIARKNSTQFAYVPTITALRADGSEDNPELRFKEFEGHYFLSGVFPATDTGREIPLTPSQMSREIRLVIAR
jgi:hypothetical protein